MYIFPLQFVFILRLTLVSLMTNSQYAQAGEVFWNVKNTLDNGICSGGIRKPASSHLYPTGTKT